MSGVERTRKSSVIDRPVFWMSRDGGFWMHTNDAAQQLAIVWRPRPLTFWQRVKQALRLTLKRPLIAPDPLPRSYTAANAELRRLINCCPSRSQAFYDRAIRRG